MISPGDLWLRPAPTPRQVRRDVVIGVLLAVSSLVTVEMMRSTPAYPEVDRHHLESIAWAVAVVAPLTVRRLFPVTVMVSTAAGFYAVGERIPGVALSTVVQVALFMSIYTAWAWARRRTALFAWSVVVVVGMFAWLVEQMVTSPVPDNLGTGIFPTAVAIAVLTFLINLVYFFGAIAWGLAARHSAEQHHRLREQAEELRRERDLNARRAVAEERLRIARELHDVVAHHVTGIGVQAAAAGHVLERDPTASRRALATIEQSSRSAVHDMHRMVGLLRSAEDQDAAGPRPSLEALPLLVASRVGGRLEARLRVVGEPVPVAPAVGESLYRVVQEALTNVSRHSTAAEAEVVLRHLDGPAPAVEVEVIDDGIPRGHDGAVIAGAGFGLRGIRERALMHGGECEVGPRPTRGFRVRVRVPAAGGAS